MIIFTMLAFYQLFSRYVSANKIIIPKFLGDASFFIFAFHMFLIIIGGLLVDFFDIPKVENPILKIVLFLINPLLTAFACVFIHLFLKRNVPKLCNILGR